MCKYRLCYHSLFSCISWCTVWRWSAAWFRFFCRLQQRSAQSGRWNTRRHPGISNQLCWGSFSNPFRSELNSLHHFCHGSSRLCNHTLWCSSGKLATEQIQPASVLKQQQPLSYTCIHFAKGSLPGHEYTRMSFSVLNLLTVSIRRLVE